MRGWTDSLGSLCAGVAVNRFAPGRGAPLECWCRRMLKGVLSPGTHGGTPELALHPVSPELVSGFWTLVLPPLLTSALSLGCWCPQGQILKMKNHRVLFLPASSETREERSLLWAAPISAGCVSSFPCLRLENAACPRLLHVINLI